MRLSNSNPLSLAETRAVSRVAALNPLTRPVTLDFILVAAVACEYNQ